MYLVSQNVLMAQGPDTHWKGKRLSEKHKYRETRFLNFESIRRDWRIEEEDAMPSKPKGFKVSK